jgi:hypothetical protein
MGKRQEKIDKPLPSKTKRTPFAVSKKERDYRVISLSRSNSSKIARRFSQGLAPLGAAQHPQSGFQNKKDTLCGVLFILERITGKRGKNN